MQEDPMTGAARLADFFRAHEATTVGVYVVPLPELEITRLAARLAGAEVVTLDAWPRIAVTADAVIEDGVLRLLKDELDEALPEAEKVVVVKHAGDVPLAPTLDAYLDVAMIPGRDVWFHDICGVPYVGASG